MAVFTVSLLDLYQQQAYLVSAISKSRTVANNMRLKLAKLESTLDDDATPRARKRRTVQLRKRTMRTLTNCEHDQQMLAENLRFCNLRIQYTLQEANPQSHALVTPQAWPMQSYTYPPVYSVCNSTGPVPFETPYPQNDAPFDSAADYLLYSSENYLMSGTAPGRQVTTLHTALPPYRLSAPTSATMESIAEEESGVPESRTSTGQSSPSDHTSESAPEFTFDPAVAPFQAKSRRDGGLAIEERPISPRTVQNPPAQAIDVHEMRRYSDPGPVLS